MAVIVNTGPELLRSLGADAQPAVSLQDSWATRMAFSPPHQSILPNINV